MKSGYDSLSIVIPNWNNGSGLARVLESIRIQTQSPQEVIVVDNLSTDESERICADFGATLLRLSSDRSQARNIGASHAVSQGVLFIDADMELTPKVVSAVNVAIRSHDAVILRELVHAGGNYWAEARALERESYFRTTVYEAARAFRRDLFLQMGGYRSALNGLEDMDFQARLLETHAKLAWVEEPLIHHESDVGIVEYLNRRSAYGRADTEFQRLHPWFWRQMISPVGRVEAILTHAKRTPFETVLRDLPGLVLQRALEMTYRGARHSREL